MVVTVFDQVFFDLFPAEVALALSIDPREGGVRFESLQPAKRLSLPLDRHFFLSDRDQQTSKARPTDGGHLFVVALTVPKSSRTVLPPAMLS